MKHFDNWVHLYQALFLKTPEMLSAELGRAHEVAFHHGGWCKSFLAANFNLEDGSVNAVRPDWQAFERIADTLTQKAKGVLYDDHGKPTRFFSMAKLINAAMFCFGDRLSFDPKPQKKLFASAIASYFGAVAPIFFAFVSQTIVPYDHNEVFKKTNLTWSFEVSSQGKFSTSLHNTLIESD